MEQRSTGFDDCNPNSICLNYGSDSQGNEAVAVGPGAAHHGQGDGAVAVGSGAGGDEQGKSSIAIGKRAGSRRQAAGGIIIDSSESGVQTLSHIDGHIIL